MAGEAVGKVGLRQNALDVHAGRAGEVQARHLGEPDAGPHDVGFKEIAIGLRAFPEKIEDRVKERARRAVVRREERDGVLFGPVGRDLEDENGPFPGIRFDNRGTHEMHDPGLVEDRADGGVYRVAERVERGLDLGLFVRIEGNGDGEKGMGHGEALTRKSRAADRERGRLFGSVPHPSRRV